MKLKHIDLNQLIQSELNVRKEGIGDIAELVASITALGILQPLLVREAGDVYEVIAGQRRLAALQALAMEGTAEPVPCMILADGDDAKAIEASLAENIQRLPMSELDQYAAFAELRSKGRSVEDIASHFGVTERLVKQRLAIANLDPRILGLYRQEAITGDTMRALTLATKTQQRAWLKRYRDPADYAPIGRQLRQWLLGGNQISTKAALFDVADYKGAIVTDLFGNESYFADASAFWARQNEAISEKVEAFTRAGWREVVVLEPASHWPEYEYRKVGKKKGGKVYVAITTSGEVAFHTGYLPEAELRKLEKKAEQKMVVEALPQRAAFTNAAHNYASLHKHASVRNALLRHEGIALRLVTAHMLGRSSLWNARIEQGRADKPETRASVDASSSAKEFEVAKEEALSPLADSDEEAWQAPSAEDIFARLLTLPDGRVIGIMTIAMAERLEAGTRLVETLGGLMKIDMSDLWSCDDAFLDLVTSRATLASMLEDIGGPDVAAAHKDSNGKTIRSVIRQFATGEGRTKVEGWLPAMMNFIEAAVDEPAPEESIAA